MGAPGHRPRPASSSCSPRRWVTALGVVGTLTAGQDVVVDARLAGVGAGALVLWWRVPVVVALGVAALTAALVRAAA